MPKCPLCNSLNAEAVYNRSGLFFTDGKTSMDLEVAMCMDCGFVFQSSAYGDEYDQKVASIYLNYRMSDNFGFPRQDKKTIKSLEFICQNIQLDCNSNILEIGSDRGDFLYLLRQRSGANIIGMEPSKEQTAMVPTLKAYFDKNSFCSKFDLIVIKHTLEHIKYPQKILQDAIESLSDDGCLYIEVPSLDVCMEYYLDDFSLDHVSYFSKQVLLNLLNEYEVVALDNTHFLRIIVKKTKTAIAKCAAIENKNTRYFFKELGFRFAALEDKIIRHTLDGGVAVFYGVGLYFRIIFAGLKDRVDKGNCYFYDDSYADECENSFGLKKIDIQSIGGQKIIAIWCSNDYTVQDAMAERFNSTIKEYEPIYFCRTNLTIMDGD